MCSTDCIDICIWSAVDQGNACKFLDNPQPVTHDPPLSHAVRAQDSVMKAECPAPPG